MLKLYGHPFSSYHWKAQIALFEKDLPFELCIISNGDAAIDARHKELWPRGKFPVLEDDGQPVFESTIIVEHLDLRHAGPRLIPADPATALKARCLDRVYDNHVQSHFQAIVGEHLPFITERPDPMRIDRARAALDVVYRWLEPHAPESGWEFGDFSLADLSAAPALFYADWVHPFPAACERLRAYRSRLNARPSVARCIEAARPYRHYFPLGAPDRD